MKHSALIILKLLLEGHPVKLPLGDEIEEFMYQDGIFGIVSQRFTIKDGKQSDVEDVILRVEVPLDGFIKMCEKVEEKDLFQMIGNITLTKWNQKER